jgi:HEAT repeat protein
VAEELVVSARSRKNRLVFIFALLFGLTFLAALCYLLSPDVRIASLRVLDWLGADTAIVNRLQDSDINVRTAAAATLIRRGDRAVPVLILRLERQDALERVTAVSVLGQIGPPASEAKSALKRLLKGEPDPNIRSQAALAFGLVGKSDPETISELIRMLGSTEEADRQGAAFACRILGADAKFAIPALIVALQDRKAEVREEALKAVSAVVNSLGDEDAALREQGHNAAIKALVELLPKKPPERP